MGERKETYSLGIVVESGTWIAATVNAGKARCFEWDMPGVGYNKFASYSPVINPKRLHRIDWLSRES